MSDAMAIDKTRAGEVARPDFLKGSGAVGAEHMTKDDVQIPRLAIAQQMSAQLLPGDPKQIPGLALGDMYNNLTGDILGRGPIEVVVIRADRPRGIEFNPMEAGGGIKDFNVPVDDPRMQFGPGGEKPKATKLYDYLLLVRPIDESNPIASVIALSLKGSGLKTAKQLNGLIRTRNAPIHSGVYRLSTSITKNAKGTFGVMSVSNAGWVTEEEFKLCTVAFETFRDKVVDFGTVDEEREPGSDDV